MNENVKTVVFLAAAAGMIGLAVLAKPTLPTYEAEDLRGQLLYPELNDPLAVTDLEIVEFDEETATIRPFEVAQVERKGKTRWVIPSHDNYPADAKDQVASAAAGLMGLRILEVAGDNVGDHQEYGVLEPDPKTLRVGSTGVGDKVIMRDKQGKELLNLIIGKEVAGRPGLRYVRKTGEDRVYVVELKTDKLSTKFENWIERNLLGINTWDMKRLWFRDYSVDELNARLVLRGETRLEYNDAGDPRWKLLEDLRYKNGRWEPLALAEDEELNIAKLDELRNALDNLKIVDVSPKPAGLSADLKAAADFTSNREAVESLMQKGFFVAQLDDQIGLFSNEGEIRITMKDGVEYVLRFGEIAGRSSAIKGAEKESAPKESEQEQSTTPGMNRYLFITAEFNPDVIPKPELTPLPEDGKKPEPAAEEKKDEPSPPPATESTEKTEKKQDGRQEQEKQDAKQSERERIEKENKRKQDEYEEKLNQGRKRVAELNDRFADWYYIISDEVYRNIRLSREEIVKKKEKGKDKKAGAEGGESVKPAAEEKHGEESAAKEHHEQEEQTPPPGVEKPGEESSPSETEPETTPADEPPHEEPKDQPK